MGLLEGRKYKYSLYLDDGSRALSIIPLSENNNAVGNLCGRYLGKVKGNMTDEELKAFKQANNLYYAHELKDAHKEGNHDR